ncbi:hypothetical protein AVEN_234496-1 [Araneus ventricosus]|uniref:Uncharacterized protein n=1 Tax=Araneus ventricosus TaxID=182803 RepID=A0A4Y2A958_ARAVE|nr:hypothetical protein AVEN_234496-1 [Araneus ventricosus]
MFSAHNNRFLFSIAMKSKEPEEARINFANHTLPGELVILSQELLLEKFYVIDNGSPMAIDFYPMNLYASYFSSTNKGPRSLHSTYPIQLGYFPIAVD